MNGLPRSSASDERLMRPGIQAEDLQDPGIGKELREQGVETGLLPFERRVQRGRRPDVGEAVQETAGLAYRLQRGCEVRSAGGLAEDGLADEPLERADASDGVGVIEGRASFHIFRISAMAFSRPGRSSSMSLARSNGSSFSPPRETIFLDRARCRGRPLAKARSRTSATSAFRAARSPILRSRRAWVTIRPASRAASRAASRREGLGLFSARRCLRRHQGLGLAAMLRQDAVRLGPGVVQDLGDDFFQAHGPAYGSLMPLRSRTVARSPRTA